jgi:hypothetical protein
MASVRRFIRAAEDYNVRGERPGLVKLRGGLDAHLTMHPAFVHPLAGSCSHGVMVPEHAVVPTKQPGWLVHVSTVS